MLLIHNHFIMNIKRVLKAVFFLTFFYSSLLCAQNNKKLDSLLNLYRIQKDDTIKAELINHIIQIELYSNPESARVYINEIIDLSKKINYSIGEAKGYYRLAGYFFNRDELDSAEVYFKKSMQLNNNINNLKGVVNDNEQLGLLFSRKKDFESAFYYLNKNVVLYNNRDSTSSTQETAFKYIGSTFHTMANAYTNLGMYKLALEKEFRALKLYEKTGNELFIADAKNSLGVIESELGNHKQALIYLDDAQKIYKINNDVFFQVLSIINIGVAFDGLKEHEKAIENYKTGIDLAKANNYKGREGLLWSNMGVSYNSIGKSKEGMRSYRNALRLFKELGYPLEASSTYSNIGKYFNTTTTLDSALYYLNKAIAISDSTGLKKVSAEAYSHRSETYKKLGNYKLSLVDYKSYSQLKDSIFNKTKSQQIEELRTIYETKKKEQEIKIQKNEIDSLNIKQKVNNLQRLLLGIGLLLALMGVYALFQRNTRNKIAKEKVEVELEFKTKELTTHALHLAKKNEVLKGLKSKAQTLKASSNERNGYQMLIQTINFDLQDDNNWESFSGYFEEVHTNFNSIVQQRYPDVTSNDLRHMALLKMNLSSKEIANILNISNDGIKKARQRLRRKLGISSEQSLEALVIAI